VITTQQPVAAPVTRTLKDDTCESPRVWGLSAVQLHDAYWHARGVQCIRRSRRVRWQRGAELYLLIEPDQLVLFDIAPLSERLTWHNALVTRLRLTDEDNVPYSERIVIDDRGLVERIERRYRPRFQGSTRVVLTSSRRVARQWMIAESRREAWDRARRAVPWPRVDHWKCPGLSFTGGDVPGEHRFLRELIDRWPDPDRGIGGIIEDEPGVWRLDGTDSAVETVRIGPLWLGIGQARTVRRCLVGPHWTDDRQHTATGAVVRDIIEVELPEQIRGASSNRAPLAYAIAKRLTDITVSLLAIVVLSPILLAIVITIAIQDGLPVFYGHRRQGRGGRPFSCWKFRTMHHNAEEQARELEEYNLCDGPQIFIKDDPRVTRLGRILRESHLDELPQLFNVLIGYMSLVGPRPSPDDENQFCPAWRDVRLSVRPGITGLWQLYRTRMPGEDFQEWIKYDIEYVRRASYILDLSILLRTGWALAFGRPERASDQTG